MFEYEGKLQKYIFVLLFLPK